MIPDAQGVTVSFDGVTISKVTSVSAGGGSVKTVDATSMACRVVGTGVSQRVILMEHPGDVSLGSIEVTFLGPQGLTVMDEGRFGTVSVAWKGGNISIFATLESFKLSGSVNDIIRGSATFKMTG
jgi:hypothetical protein